MDQKIKNYAFVDVQNTEGTTKQLLKFTTDWVKLYFFLKNEKHCDKVFMYTGIDKDDSYSIKMWQDLENMGCNVKSKIVADYRNKIKEIKLICPKCNYQFIKNVNSGYNHKANCDVDLTVDAMQLIGENIKLYLFTGDGDFVYLVETAVKNKTKVAIVSSNETIKYGPNCNIRRLSKKLRKLEGRYFGMVANEDINNYRYKIERIN